MATTYPISRSFSANIASRASIRVIDSSSIRSRIVSQYTIVIRWELAGFYAQCCDFHLVFLLFQCDKKFKCPYRLKYHKTEHAPGSEQQCNVCLKMFPTMIRLQQHQIMHSKTRKCSHYTNLFYNSHLTFLDDKIYQCSECDKSFKCKYRLKYHEMNHFHKAYECPMCSKRFALPSRLAQHLSIHDDNTPIFACEICNKSFKNKYRLKYHVSTHHEVSGIKQEMS